MRLFLIKPRYIPAVKQWTRAFAQIPWYVDEGAEQVAKHRIEMPIPDMPSNPPSKLEPITKYVVQDLGLMDTQIIDGRDRETALGPAIMIVGTGKSNRHLGNAAAQLLNWLKKEYNVAVDTEGILTANFIKTQSRRAQRRARQQGLGEQQAWVEAFAKVGSWVVLNTNVDNIYVHLLTEDRRRGLDLEHLWTHEPLPQKQDSFDEQYFSPAQMPSGRRQFHTVAPRNAMVSESSQSLMKGDYKTLTGDESLVAHINHMLLAARDPNYELTESSPVVTSFFESWPTLPSREQWKLRLYFIVTIFLISNDFPLRKLVDHIRLQQASGYMVDQEDLEQIFCAIAYYRQAEFATKRCTPETKAQWTELCNEKSKTVINIHNIVFRSNGTSLLVNNRLITLLFRMYAGPSATSVDPQTALEDPTPGPRPAMFVDSRLAAIQMILEDSSQLLDSRTLMLVLTTLINGHTWSTFWRILDSVTGIANVDERIIEAAMAMVVKTGNEVQIRYALDRFLPSLLLQNKASVTPALTRTLNIALEIVDSERKAYRALRQVIANNQK